MSKPSKYLLLFIVVFGIGFAKAQKHEVDIGDVYFEFFNFEEAIKHYELALDMADEKSTPYILRQLAISNKYSFKYKQAETWYVKLLEGGNKVENEDIREYGVMLKNNGKYEDAKMQFEIYQKLTLGKDPVGVLQNKSINWAIRNKEAVKPVTLTLTDLDMNGQCLGYCLMDDGIIYAHADSSKQIGTMKIFDLDFAVMKDTVHFGPATNAISQINFATNEGAPSINKEAGLFYFNANASNIKKGNIKKVGGLQINNEGVSNFKIYVSEFLDGDFRNIEELPFNGKNYNCIHPCISENGDVLYFASDMEGGYGGLDLYMAKRNIEGVWDKPVNLGESVNTVANELFPFVHMNRIYFASKGFNGYGGYDIYTAKLSMNGMPAAPQNMGLPINSYRDDMGMVVYKDGQFGYLSSNRDNDDGADKLYFFHDHTLDPIQPVLVKAPVDSVKPIAKVETVSKPTTAENEMLTTPKATAALPAVAAVSVIPEKKNKGAKPTKENATTNEVGKKENKENLNTDILIQKQFSHIRFRLNDYKPDGNFDQVLDSLITLAQSNREVKIRIYAYADARGTEAYNMALSVKRALAVKQYLTARGLKSNRIITAGFGESNPLNNCTDDIACSEEEHAINRRVEVLLIR